MGTGIIFVVLVAIWVAYFVQYLSRRREHLATARSVEAFSEAMRVLERRPPRAAQSARGSRAYAMSPARASRPAPRPHVVAKPRTAPTRPGGVSGMRLPTSPRPVPAARTRAAAARVRPSRAVRGLTLLATLVATLVVLGLSAFAVVVWWAPFVGVGATIASFLWLRAGVQAEIKARRARRRPVRRPRPATGGASTAAPAESPVELVDHAVEGGHLESVTASADLGVAVFGERWSPVPVPPPTYTLKARAEPREAPSFAPPAEAEPAVAMPDVVPDAAEDEARATAYGT